MWAALLVHIQFKWQEDRVSPSGGWCQQCCQEALGTRCLLEGGTLLGRQRIRAFLWAPAGSGQGRARAAVWERWVTLGFPRSRHAAASPVPCPVPSPGVCRDERREVSGAPVPSAAAAALHLQEGSKQQSSLSGDREWIPPTPDFLCSSCRENVPSRFFCVSVCSAAFPVSARGHHTRSSQRRDCRVNAGTCRRLLLAALPGVPPAGVSLCGARRWPPCSLPWRRRQTLRL